LEYKLTYSRQYIAGDKSQNNERSNDYHRGSDRRGGQRGRGGRGKDRGGRRDKDDWKGRRDDFQKTELPKDDVEEDNTKSETVDAPTTKRARDETEDVEPDTKKNKTEVTAEA
jgi:hypothetical protein